MEESTPEGTKIVLKAGNKYSICTCGHSKTLPFCDNSHRLLNKEKGASYKSVKIWPENDVELKVFSKNWEKYAT